MTSFWRPLRLAPLLGLSLTLPCWAQTQTQTQDNCRADPLQGRALYLRGSFNSWGAAENQRLIWACDRYELVTKLNGEHSFKFGDEGWSADADFGAGPVGITGMAVTPPVPGAVPGATTPLRLRGTEIKRRFDGVQRFTLTIVKDQFELRVRACPDAAPLGDTVLFLRGGLNNWAALDDYAFQYSCDAYYLNIKANGRQAFKIADTAWKDTNTFGSGGIGAGAGEYVHLFEGEQTLRLAFDNGKPKFSVGPRTFADPTAKSVTDPIALSLRFDSRNWAHKSPFGAVVAGSTLDFAVTASAGVQQLTLVLEKRRLQGNQEVLDYAEFKRLPMTRSSAKDGEPERWSAQQALNDMGIYGYWFEAEIGGRKFALQNNPQTVHWTREKGAGGAASVGDLPTSLSGIRRFRQTVYAADFKVPDWAADAVYYFIFPDRFRNGNPRNDPKPGRDRYQNHGVEFHKNWNDKPFKPGVIDGKTDGSDTVYNNDFFGGDLAGILEKLDYIQALGANVIYMTPIFKAASNHKYDTADYRNIDPVFGSNADFKRLTVAAQKRGIRILPDASLNHTGADSIYFNRFGNYGKSGAFQNSQINLKSPYADWYSFDATQSDPNKRFKGWVGVGDLPELNKASKAFRKFAFEDANSVMKLWLDRGASGWRMDVAPWVPDDFWRAWRKEVKTHRPDAITIAETWFDASKYFLGDMFDSTMNYVLRNALLDYAGGGDAADLVRHIEHLREAYPPQALYALMNLLSSHDQARALHVLGWNDANAAPATVAMAKQRLRLATFFLMTHPGAPTVYYGDEVGVTGGDDPFNRATYPWADKGGQPDEALLADFKKLSQLRRDHPVLRRGSNQAPLFVDKNVVVLARKLGEGAQAQWALTATNNASQPRTVTVKLPAEANASANTSAGKVAGANVWTDPLGGPAVTALEGTLSFEVPALFGRVLLSR
jgi:cyclomaltodextrinase / maltogenic alpha-amylase / neopullulanase